MRFLEKFKGHINIKIMHTNTEEISLFDDDDNEEKKEEEIKINNNNKITESIKLETSQIEIIKRYDINKTNLDINLEELPFL